MGRFDALTPMNHALETVRRRGQLLVLAACCLLAGTTNVLAQETTPLAVEVEGALLWQSRNDVRIPNDESATEFSLVDAIGSGPFGAFRIEADVDFNDRHGLRFVVAPLTVNDTGTLAENVSFAGENFTPGSVDASYKFSSYRVTYRYAFFRGDRWRWRVGFTAFIRDARIALEQNGVAAEDTDVGFVPLVHLQGRAKLGEKWQFVLDLDGLGASQGRAFDISAKLRRQLGDHWDLSFGYRTIEGGADVEDVFNFAWLNFAVASIRYSF